MSQATIENLFELAVDLQTSASNDKDSYSSTFNAVLELNREANVTRQLGSSLLIRGLGLTETTSIGKIDPTALPLGDVALGIFSGFAPVYNMAVDEQESLIDSNSVACVLSKPLGKGSHNYICPVTSSIVQDLAESIGHQTEERLMEFVGQEQMSLHELRDIVKESEYDFDVIAYINTILSPQHLASFIKPSYIYHGIKEGYLRYGPVEKFIKVNNDDYFSIGSDNLGNTFVNVDQSSSKHLPRIISLEGDFAYF